MVASSYRQNPLKNHCWVDGCDNVYRSGGYCGMHYARFKKWGTPEGAPELPPHKHFCLDCSRPINKVSTRCQQCSGKHRSPGSQWRTKRGYVTLSGHSDHPNARARGLIYEHTLVMSQMIGRPLMPGENVHHKNGVKYDNRPENLELWVTTQPAGQRPADLVEWAHEILRRYA